MKFVKCFTMFLVLTTLCLNFYSANTLTSQSSLRSLLKNQNSSPSKLHKAHVMFKNNDTGKCLTLGHKKHLHQATCNKTDVHQRFQLWLSHKSTKSYIIYTRGHNKLTIEQKNLEKSSKFIAQSKYNKKLQHFFIRKNGYNYQMKSRHGKKCIDVYKNHPEKAAAFFKCSYITTKFKLIELKTDFSSINTYLNKWITIKNNSTNKCFEVKDNYIVQEKCNPSNPKQNFILKKHENGVKIFSICGKVIKTLYLSNYSKLKMSKNKSSGRYKYAINKKKDGAFTILNFYSFRCLHIKNANKKNGSKVQIYDCNGNYSKQQHFSFKVANGNKGIIQ